MRPVTVKVYQHSATKLIAAAIEKNRSVRDDIVFRGVYPDDKTLKYIQWADAEIKRQTGLSYFGNLDDFKPEGKLIDIELEESEPQGPFSWYY
jgi:hypothetical protein